MPKTEELEINNFPLLCIDPGKNCGYAIFNEEGDLIKHGILTSAENDDVKYVLEQTNNIYEVLDEHDIGSMIIEGVSLWSANPKSMISASKGNLFVLAYLVGAVIDMSVISAVETFITYPKDWKGNMPKKVSTRRVIDEVGKITKNEHTLDAIGIGLSHFGKL